MAAAAHVSGLVTKVIDKVMIDIIHETNPHDWQTKASMAGAAVAAFIKAVYNNLEDIDRM